MSAQQKAIECGGCVPPVVVVPGPKGMDVVDSTGVLTGNADLECAEQGWSNMPPTADGHAAPLPIYPTPEDMPPDPVIRDALREMASSRGGDLLIFGAGCGFGGFLLGVVF